MSGLIVSETTLNVTSLVNSWINYLNACTQLKNDPDSVSAQQAVIGSAANLASAVKALSGNPILSAALSTVGGLTNITNDVAAYQNAVAQNQSASVQNAALASVANDAAGIGGGAATAIAAAAQGLGDGALAEEMAVIASRANAFGILIGVVPVLDNAGSWFNNTFLPGFNKWIGNVPASQDGDMLTPMNGPDGNPAIIMAGTPGDTIATTSLGGGAFQYSEVTNQGAVTSSVTLAQNGATDVEYISGQGVNSDVRGFQVNLAASSSATVNGGSDQVFLGANSSLTTSGSGFSVNTSSNNTITGIGDQINIAGNLAAGQSAGVTTVIGNSSTINAGTAGVVALIGQNDLINGISDQVYLSAGTSVSTGSSGLIFNTSTNNTITAISDQINVGSNLVAGQSAGVTTVIGDSSTINAGTQNTLAVVGQNDLINGISDQVYLGAGTSISTGSAGLVFNTSTNNTITALSDQINVGSNLVAGQSAGVTTVIGNSSTINGGAANTLAIIGQNDLVNGISDQVYLSAGTSVSTGSTGLVFNTSTNNTITAISDQINVGSNLVSGQSAGVTTVIGNSSTINGGTANTLAVIGQNDLINGISDQVYLSAGTSVTAGSTGLTFNTSTNNTITAVLDQINVGANLATGQSASTTAISGGSDNVNLGGTGDYLTLLSGTNYNVTSQLSTITAANGTSFALTGTSNSLIMGSSCSVSVNGNGNDIGMSSGSSIIDNGVNNVIDASGSEIVVGAGAVVPKSTLEVNGDNNYIYAGDNASQIIINVHGTGNYVYANNGSVFFSSANNYVVGNKNMTNGTPVSTFNAVSPVTGSSFPSIPVLGGDNGVIAYAVPTEGGGVPGSNLTVTMCPDGIDPIILNLNGDSVATTSLSTSGASFDMQNNGKKVQTGWGTAGEGYLVYDPNDATNSTAVTQDSQLVGGFGALQSLAQQVDGTSDGSLTSSDALWNSLKVWVDPTGTANFQSGELLSLSQLGITSIDLNGTQVSQNSNGNEILVDSSFTYANGKTGDIAGVDLKYNPNVTSSAEGNTATLSDTQLSSLIAAMASYGTQSAASSTLAPAQTAQESMLLASAH
ncbi:S-layer family protein [Burkholderia sp. 9120]|uniref:beta strand repeat-containing protein n=1 Tax=Burkholderia sp. 9120 TaxID=1500897 RepID=UPI000A6DBA53|nr:S-layer family protein [Burkholderia sp. 9120]